MLQVTLELEAEWAKVLRPLTDQPLDSFVKELAVLELYRRRLIASGKAAELANMSRSIYQLFVPARHPVPGYVGR